MHFDATINPGNSADDFDRASLSSLSASSLVLELQNSEAPKQHSTEMPHQSAALQSLGFPSSDQINFNPAHVIQASERGILIEGPDFVGTDPGDVYRAHGTMRQPARISLHDGAKVYAGDGSVITADGGTVYATSGAVVSAIKHTIVYYKDGASVNARDSSEVYHCASGSSFDDVSTCHRER